MKNLSLFFLVILVALILSCGEIRNSPNTEQKPKLLMIKEFTPPIATKIPQELKKHGDTRIDDYYWMKLSDEQKNKETPDEQTQKVIDYLEAENAYKNDMLAHTQNFQEQLFKEIKGRIKQTDLSVPYKSNGYFYLTKYEEGKEYPIHVRKKESLDNKEEILLDINVLAKGFDYYNVSGKSVSPNNQILAYSEDTLSRRIYSLKFKDLTTGELLPDIIENTTGGVVWANDNKTIFYTRKDAALRAFKIFKHKLGTNASQDVEVFHEKDETFGTFVYKSKSKQFIIIGSYSTLSNEYRYLDANSPDGKFEMFQARERNLEYSIAHYGDKWYIKTNKDDAKNFKIMTSSLANTTKDFWVDLIPHRQDVLVESMDLFESHMVISERIQGITEIRIKSWDNKHDYYIDFEEEAHLAYVSINPDFESEDLRIGYTSMTTPNSTYDFNMNTKKMVLLKQQEVLGSFDKSNYKSERIYAKAKDGTLVPISLVYHNDYKKDGSQSLLLYGYGSYGNSMDPYFSSVRLSLLDRGMAFAIAHIRGGEEMGRHWYEDGKLFNKKNTFTDFIACGEHLVYNKYVAANKLFAMGGSAGGLLMGAVVNMKPDLWKGVVASVPFVDVVTTMLDETIPLTTGEYDEWGNPNEKEYYDYIKSYSPYDNIEKIEFPSMLITTGYHDSQVQYWEPAKWIAKIRANHIGNNPILLHCDMQVGHGGASGRFERFKETAMEYAFILDLAGKSE